MVSRSTIAASLVVVVLLAGCSGIVGESGPESPDDVELASGFAADGVTDGERAVDSYSTALGETSNYTIEYEGNFTTPNQDVAYDGEYRVDVDGERAYHRSELSSRNLIQENYFADGQQFTRRSQGDQSRVASGERAFVQENMTGASVLEPLLSNETDYETSLGERDGTTVVVYETSGAENAAATFDVDAGNVTAFTASFAVDADGLVRDASYDLRYVAGSEQDQRVSMTFDLRDVGETSVERPEWTTEA